jgi:hypothetical protein
MKSPTKQRFELTAGTSDKFWEVSVDGTDVEVRFGRNGTNGQTNIKSFPTLNAARGGHLVAILLDAIVDRLLSVRVRLAHHLADYRSQIAEEIKG